MYQLKGSEQELPYQLSIRNHMNFIINEVKICLLQSKSILIADNAKYDHKMLSTLLSEVYHNISVFGSCIYHVPADKLWHMTMNDLCNT